MSLAIIKPRAHIRSISPDPLVEEEYCPELTASISNDTRASSTDSYNSKSIPIKKPSRFGSLFSANSSRSVLKMTPMADDDIQHNRRTSSSGQSFTSIESTSENQSPRQHRFAKSIGNLIVSPASWTRKHLHHKHTSEPSSPSANVPKLNEKYGDYVKPNKHASTKASGATNKNNIGSGATAVIRLVQSGGKTLAVKEFRKRDKSEDEKEYLKRMHNEYCISKAVSGNVNVVETMDLVVDEHDRWCTVMEYVSGKYL